MAVVEDKVDLTASLPDELLHQMFTYLPLRDKLRIESVSHRFQRCVLALLELQPQPLELNTETKHLNRYSIQSWKVNDALWSLAKRAKFSSIKIHIGWTSRNAEQTAEMDSVLSVLSLSDSLDNVVSFECNYGPSQHMLETVIAQCSKLTTVTFDFFIHHPEVEDEQSPWHQDAKLLLPNSVALDLSSVLGSKALTQLDLRLSAYMEVPFYELFVSLKPRTLQKLSLTMSELVNLVAQSVMVLSADAWAALQEINLCWKDGFRSFHAFIDLAAFFKSLDHIPALNKCHVELGHFVKTYPEEQFVEAVTALFNSDIKITLSVGNGCNMFETYEDYCVVVAKIPQMQAVHPNIRVDFCVKDVEFLDRRRRSFLNLTLSMGNGIFEELVDVFDEFSPCEDEGCLECRRFYPTLLSRLNGLCYGINQDTHLEDHQLIRCKIDTLVEHLNAVATSKRQRALSAEVNGDLVTLVVEVRDTNDENVKQYNITIDCVPCFSSSCIRCVNVE